MTHDEMVDYTGATSLHFLSFDGMIKATGLPASNFTSSCFTGEYPIPIGKRANEIVKLKPGETLPRAGHKPTLLATARTT
jgi:amidophosphoribosyltransferase